jgi:hypothetical protein
VILKLKIKLGKKKHLHSYPLASFNSLKKSRIQRYRWDRTQNDKTLNATVYNDNMSSDATNNETKCRFRLIESKICIIPKCLKQEDRSVHWTNIAEQPGPDNQDTIAGTGQQGDRTSGEGQSRQDRYELTVKT